MAHVIRFGSESGLPIVMETRLLMAPSVMCINNEPERDRFMVYLLMKPPCFSTQTLMGSSIPHIRLSSIAAEMPWEAEQTFSMGLASDVAWSILLTLSWMIPQSFSVGDWCAWAVAWPCSLHPKSREVGLSPMLGAGSGVSWGSVLLKWPAICRAEF